MFFKKIIDRGNKAKKISYTERKFDQAYKIALLPSTFN